MIPFSSLLLRQYYAAIGWNQDNSYTQFNRSSDALIDFQIPSSLVLQLSNSPTPIFFTSYSLDALPQLNGSLSYLTTSEPLPDIGPSRTVPFHHIVERFRVYPPPHRPPPKDEIWQGGRRVEGRDYMLYSRLHLPSLHLSGLATTRLTPTLQAHLAFLSQPAPPSTRPSSPSSGHSRQPSESSPPPFQAPSNILLSLQHDTGRCSGEYTYSAQDGMFGIRGLYNFGWKNVIEDVDESAFSRDDSGKDAGSAARIDEEEMMEGGLRGRFSAGGEVYFSAKQRSFGISTGLRFATLPGASTPNSPPASPPTTLTLLYNPLMGFISSAYSAQLSPTVAVSSRFGVNVYSYESDLSLGAEWWIGRRRGKRNVDESEAMGDVKKENHPDSLDMRQRESSVRFESLRTQVGKTAENEKLEDQLDSPIPLVSKMEEGQPPAATLPVTVHSTPAADTRDRDGVLKGRISGNWSIALLYEARIRNCLVSLGVNSDILNRQRPIKSIGVEVQYFT